MTDGERLIERMDFLLRSLRTQDTQAKAVAWMAQAYAAMEAAIPMLRDQPAPQAPAVIERVETKIVLVDHPRLVVAHRLPTGNPANQAHPSSSWFTGKTIVTPEPNIRPLKPLPMPWTQRQQRKLNAETDRRRKGK